MSLPGSTTVVQQFAIEKYSHVQHIVSRVRGELRPGLDAMHAYRAAANMGTLTGAPKVRAMELIRLAEPVARGFYGGAAGYLLQDGRFDSCIVITITTMHSIFSYRCRIQLTDSSFGCFGRVSRTNKCSEIFNSIIFF